LINISISKEQTKQILLVAFLVVCVALAILILIWAEEPERRPLIQNIQLVDAVKIIDALEASKITYVTRLDSQMILVRDEDMDHARLALARIGIVIDYPDVRQMANASEACDILETKIYEHTNNPNIPITEKPYFLKLVKLMMGTLIIMVLIITVIRPALRNLLEKFDDKDEP
jgi:flagellar biosynthesis/type III secretory pathway M-ring protein FliF/YscJ